MSKRAGWDELVEDLTQQLRCAENNVELWTLRLRHTTERRQDAIENMMDVGKKLEALKVKLRSRRTK